MRETDLLEPNSYYAVAKGAQTLLCQHVAKAEQRPITTFRLFSVYGPFEEPSRLIPTLVRLCLEGRNLTLVDPETARDFVYIDDVVDAYLRIDKLAGLCGEVMVYRSRDGLGVRHGGLFTVDERPCKEQGVLCIPSVVDGETFRFSLEALGSRL